MANEKTELELLEEISKRLGQILGVLAIQGKTQNEQIEILDGLGLGFDSKTLGLFVGLSGDAVRQRKTQMKRKGKK